MSRTLARSQRAQTLARIPCGRLRQARSAHSVQAALVPLDGERAACNAPGRAARPSAAAGSRLISLVPFRTRARTVDHLGREQIADAPTAVSELWKNAYDAYARRVELHIFDASGEKSRPVAAIVDNGHGMSRDEFVERWLVLGTEAKLAETEVPVADRNGLPKRVRQGQKGIGRLSVAALGPLTLVLTKRTHTTVTAALVDWRLFENPFLTLEDVFIPVEELATFNESAAKKRFAAMMDGLIDNVSARSGEPARNRRVNAAWERYDRQFHEQGLPAPSERITETLIASWIEARHLDVWEVWREESKHGTALFILDPHRELTVWAEPKGSDDEATFEASEAKLLMERTLSRFTDIFADPDGDLIHYRAVVHRGDAEQEIVGDEHDFGLDDFHQLEHFVEGRFDENGVFSGTIRFFGRNAEPILYPPSAPVPQKGSGYVGPFNFLIGTFERDPISSTHPHAKITQLESSAAKYSGIALYRDNLRIMPYGRPNSDLFELEERRSQHAGREFWSHRRSFGRVALSYRDNPNLRDKAGREGLIDNQARRELQRLIIDLLRHTARYYFGTDSENRKRYLPEIEARNEKGKESDEKARTKRHAEFKTALRKKFPELAKVQAVLVDVLGRLERALKQKKIDAALGREIEKLVDAKGDLRLPPKPAQLTGKLEAEYRKFRDQYSDLCASVDDLQQRWNQALETFGPRSTENQAKTALERNRQHIESKVTEWLRQAQDLLRNELARRQEQAKSDIARYAEEATPVLASLRGGLLKLSTVLTRLELLKDAKLTELEPRWTSYIRTLEQLAEDIDVDEALRYNNEQRVELEQRVGQVYSLAQLGIVVEIIGHELNELDAELRRHLGRLPKAVQATEPFKSAMTTQRKLVDQLRFLAPMQLAGRRLREEITGAQLYEYVRTFFAGTLEARKASLSATEEFQKLRISEYRSRLQPVFLNLVNNSLYWIAQNKPGAAREIRLAMVADAIIVADSGPGVDPDDVPRLFQLFFSRKTEGRGVGLYLCRMNLEMGGHSIAYAEEARHRVLRGANFVIRLSGIRTG